MIIEFYLSLNPHTADGSKFFANFVGEWHIPREGDKVQVRKPEAELTGIVEHVLLYYSTGNRETQALVYVRGSISED